MSPRFVADVMLKDIARWLRMMNMQVIYAGDFAEDDDEITKMAAKNNAILLTKDVEMFEKAKSYCRAELLKSNDPTEILAQLVKKFNLKFDSRKIAKICPDCGDRLIRVQKSGIKARVFPKTYKFNKIFWECENKKCGKIYWKGGHFEKIIETLKKVKEKAAN
jgi:hypothetical protein